LLEIKISSKHNFSEQFFSVPKEPLRKHHLDQLRKCMQLIKTKIFTFKPEQRC